MNSRIRKAYLNNNIDIFSIGDVGDLTYPYESLENSTKVINEIINNKNKLSDLIKKSQKPMIILGQSILKMKSAPYVFEELKKYLLTNNKINDDWNAFNILSNNASTVGSYDLELFSSKNGENETLKKIKKNEFDVIFLFGQENLKFKKKNEFIIYIGSHGDRGAEIADIILPSAAYTEQEGYYANLEGKMQKAYNASYPPGEAKEDWQIINELAASLKRKNLFINKEELVNSMINFLNMNKDKNFEVPNYEFINENIYVDDLDYYHSNAIARASKTMSECKNLSSNIKKTGTDG